MTPDTHITENQTALNQLHVVTKLGNELITLTSRINDACPKCRETGSHLSARGFSPVERCRQLP